MAETMRYGITKTAKRLLQCAGLVCLAAFIIGCAVIFIWFEEPILYYAAGVAWGYVVTCARAVSLDRSLQKSTDMGGNKAKGYAFLQFFFRYILTFGALAAAVFVPFINMWGAFIGVLSLQPAAYLAGFLMKDKDLDIQQNQ